MQKNVPYLTTTSWIIVISLMFTFFVHPVASPSVISWYSAPPEHWQWIFVSNFGLQLQHRDELNSSLPVFNTVLPLQEGIGLPLPIFPSISASSEGLHLKALLNPGFLIKWTKHCNFFFPLFSRFTHLLQYFNIGLVFSVYDFETSTFQMPQFCPSYI